MTNFDDDEPKPNLQAVADLIAQQVNQSNQASIEIMRQRNRATNKQSYGCDCDQARCFKTCPTYLINCAEDDRWLWLATSKPPDRREVEVMPPGEPDYKGGGCKSRKRKKKPPASWFVNPYLD